MARSFHFVASLSLRECGHALVAALPGLAMHAHSAETCFLDRADRALRRQGWLLECRRLRQQFGLRLRRLGHSRELTTTNITAAPARVTDIADPSLHARLARRLGSSTLVPVHAWRAQGIYADYRNNDAKIVCRITATTYRPATTKGTVELPLVIELIPLRGYQHDTAALAAALCARLPLDALADDYYLLLEDAYVTLATSARRPVGTPLGTQPAAPIIAAVLLDYHATLCAQVPATRIAISPAQVHNFRVALRRSRSLLRAFREVLGRARQRRFRNDFAWLNRVSGRLRDLDVLAAALDSSHGPYGELDPGEHQRLCEHIAHSRTQDEQALLGALASTRYQSLRRAWPAALASLRLGPPSRTAPTFNASARPALRQALTRVHRDSRGFRLTPSAAVLHTLRKRCKRLRYLVEAWTALYPHAEISPALTLLKRLQTLMGEHCDRNAQLELLDDWRRRARGPTAHLRPVLRRLRRQLGAQGGIIDDEELCAALTEFDRPAQHRALTALLQASDA